MYVIRDLMYCKPAKVRPMVEKLKALSVASEKVGMGKMRIMTDFCAERYWTVVTEMEVESIEKFTELSRNAMADPEFKNAMGGYHDLVDSGRREIYIVE